MSQFVLCFSEMFWTCMGSRNFVQSSQPCIPWLKCQEAPCGCLSLQTRVCMGITTEWLVAYAQAIVLLITWLSIVFVACCCSTLCPVVASLRSALSPTFPYSQRCLSSCLKVPSSLFLFSFSCFSAVYSQTSWIGQRAWCGHFYLGNWPRFGLLLWLIVSTLWPCPMARYIEFMMTLLAGHVKLCVCVHVCYAGTCSPEPGTFLKNGACPSCHYTITFFQLSLVLYVLAVTPHILPVQFPPARHHRMCMWLQRLKKWSLCDAWSASLIVWYTAGVPFIIDIYSDTFQKQNWQLQDFFRSCLVSVTSSRYRIKLYK